jgi:hypothetical protein
MENYKDPGRTELMIWWDRIGCHRDAVVLNVLRVQSRFSPGVIKLYSE